MVSTDSVISLLSTCCGKVLVDTSFLSFSLCSDDLIFGLLPDNCLLAFFSSLHSLSSFLLRKTEKKNQLNYYQNAENNNRYKSHINFHNIKQKVWLVWFSLVWFGLVWSVCVFSWYVVEFNGHINNCGLLMPNPFLYIETVLFQTIQFSISTRLSSIWPKDWALSGTTTPGHSGPGSDGNEGSAPNSTKLKNYWNLIIRLLSVISRKLIWRVLTSQKRSNWCILQAQHTELNVKTVLFQTIYFSISTQFKCQNSPISNNSV